MRSLPSAAAVVGAGILGRLLALKLQRAGVQVTLFEQAAADSRASCSFAAAGLLTPLSEGGAASEPEVVRLGLQSRRLWAELAATLPGGVVVGQEGSLTVARTPDLEELMERFQRLKRRFPEAPCQWLEGEQLAAVAPALAASGFAAGLYLEGEGYVQSHRALEALQKAHQGEGVMCRYQTEIAALEPHRVVFHRPTGEATEMAFDLVIDARGYAARSDLPTLRGVRGELIEVHAPQVQLSLPLSVMHPRYPIYVVPRGADVYAIGATCLESDSMAGVTVKAALELLTAAYQVHPGFRFAEILRLVAHCRPAFPTNLPQVKVRPGLWQANGLYRHGFLLAPVVVELMLKALQNGFDALASQDQALFHGDLS